MKKILYIVIILVSILLLTGCEEVEEPPKNGRKEATGEVYEAKLDDDGNIVIDKMKITKEVSYYSYEYEGVIISILAVKDENGKNHIMINTCTSCGGSPYAYFVQVNDKLQCQNCGNLFVISKLDEVDEDGCNPIKIENIEEKGNSYVIDHYEIEMYKDKFLNWYGPK